MDSLTSLPSREALISPMTDGHFRLISAADAHPLTRIVFNNRKAARNWASGRGYNLLEFPPSGGR